MDSKDAGETRELTDLTHETKDLQDLNVQMARFEGILLEVQTSIASQSVVLQDLHSQIFKGSLNQSPAISLAVASAPMSSRSILKKQVRTEDEAEMIPLPMEMPQNLPILPGEVKATRLTCSEASVPKPRRKAPSNRSHLRPDGPSSRTNHAATLDELSTIMARELLQTHSRSDFSARSPSSDEHEGSASDDMKPSREAEAEASSDFAEERGNSKKSNLAVLEKTQKMSLDELRTNHDAQALAGFSTSRTASDQLDHQGGMPFCAELWMMFSGILDVSLRKSWLWGSFVQVLGLAATGVLLYLSINELVHVDITLTTICYMFGVTVSVWLLRAREVQELLGAQEGNLDLYARKAGFIREWRTKSFRRLFECLSFLIIMCVSRSLGYSQELLVLPYDLLPNAAYCCAASGFSAVLYFQLHILSGLELAIDSFSINFFRAMNIQDALLEWNVVQASLRHISSKLSRSLLIMGSSCCGASLLCLIDLAFVRSDAESGFAFLFQTFWLLPPVIFFLYGLMRAAAVTEKASRVAPLVNSWTFHHDDEEVSKGMDLGRQYVVQHIIQSEAGFYMQGMRLRIFQVTKMCYYFGAFLFAIFSRIGG